MRIYDYNNNITEIELPNNKLIKKIHVVILSGDETGTVIFSDGSKIDFDACKGNRLVSFFDGEYDIEGDIMIQKWMEWTPPDLYLTRSYKRKEWFEKEIRIKK